MRKRSSALPQRSIRKRTFIYPRKSIRRSGSTKRLSITVLNAYVGPVVTKYLSTFDNGLKITRN